MRRLVTFAYVSALSCLLVHALPGTVLGQSTKLAGTVTDGATGASIPGATVILEGTTLGTATAADGSYFIIGIQPGTYTVRFSFVGYASKSIENVLVTSDRTTSLDATIETEVVQGAEVTITALRPVVDQNQTVSRAHITAEEIKRLPVGGVQDLLKRTSNSYEGFIRGSRRYETRTILDGIDISDNFNQIANGGSVGNTYDNVNKITETNPSLFDINTDAVSEIAVTTGATEARYGSASGGVVTMALTEGRGPIRGSFTFRAAPKYDRPGPDSLGLYEDADEYFAEKAAKEAAGLPSADLYTWTPDKYAAGDDPELNASVSVGGSITDKWGFFATGQYFDTHGWQPNEHRRRINAHLKTTYQLGQSTRITGLGVFEDKGLWGGWNNTSYNDFWRFYLEGLAQNDAGSYLGALKVTHSLNNKSFIDVQVYTTYKRTRYGYVDDDGNGFQDLGENGDFIDLLDPAIMERYIGVGADKSKYFYENISDGFSDTGLFLPAGNRFKTARPSPYQEDSKQSTVGFMADYTSQVAQNHFVQAGTELKLRTFEYVTAIGIDQTGSKLNGPLEPYAPGEYSRSPFELAVYASDRMEYAGLIVNLGLRVQLVDRDMEKFTDDFYPYFRDSVQVGDNLLARNFSDRTGSVDMDVLVNPSIGVSHPIGTNANMYFSFARNQQLLPYTTLYSFYWGNHSNSRFFNRQDPEQGPITSNNYELGVQWEFVEGTGLDVNAYMRSIDNYGQSTLAATQNPPEGEGFLAGSPTTFFTTFGYADVRGIEVVLRRRPTSLTKEVALGLTASYTFSTVEQAIVAGANIRSFNAEEGQTELPFEDSQDWKNFPQNVRGGRSTLTGGYDRRHRLLLRSVLELPIEFSVGLVANVETGFLYPKEIEADPRDRALLTGPTNYSIDFRVEKRFSFGSNWGVDLFFDVTNITNRFNIVGYDTATATTRRDFEETGVPGSRIISKDGTSLYGQARTIFFGTRLSF